MSRSRTHSPPRELYSYKREIHRPLTQLLLIGPMLLFFQIGSALAGSDLLVPEYLAVALRWFGANGRYLPALLIVGVLLGQHLTRKDPWQPSFWTAGGMILESAIWVLPLLAAGWMTTRTAAGAESDRLFRGLLESVGAGVYEEFLFRLVLISMVNLLLVDVLGVKRLPAAVVGMAVSTLAFVALHFSPDQWTHPGTLPWARVMFLLMAGAWWSLLYIWRGYAIAACNHVWWDVLVVLLTR